MVVKFSDRIIKETIMNKQFIISTALFFILITTFISCDSVTDSNKKDENYFPVKVTNSWTYYSLHDSLTSAKIISKKIVINSKDYYIYTNTSGDYAGDTIRIENNRVYRWFNNSEILWFDFDSENNHKYNFLDYNVTVTRNLSVKCKAGTFNNCIGFYFDMPYAVDEEHEYFFAKGVGIVRINSAWFDFYLDDYKLAEK
jgi:hypothetical protein